jgi:hypothetical protein
MSTARDIMCVDGKSEASWAICGADWEGERSRRARPVRPCSRRQRDAERARVPAPPVTIRGEGRG